VADSTAASSPANRLRVEEIDDTHWRLLEPYAFASAVTGTILLVPAGFVTDFASVPRVPIAYWLVGNTAHGAAVIHDWLYTTGAFPKETADAVFREAMRDAGVPWWRRWMMYLGVRWGGTAAWERHRRADRS